MFDSFDYLLYCARCCSMLLHVVSWQSKMLTPKFRIICYVCTNSMGHSAGAHGTLEMLDEMLDSFDHPEQSSTEHGSAKLYAAR